MPRSGPSPSTEPNGADSESLDSAAGGTAIRPRGGTHDVGAPSRPLRARFAMLAEHRYPRNQADLANGQPDGGGRKEEKLAR